MLERIGFEFTTTVKSGYQALIEADKSHHHLVINDIQMPKMDGFELSRVINSKMHMSGSKPVVMGLAAETSETLHEQALESGMLTLLFKPMTAIQMK
mmetsp:Transcript_80/g.99  ORF Transcript_80/g.99 Transcript_80/m.99 type:complete len:97 (+) Transcript_80:633-923(+)